MIDSRHWNEAAVMRSSLTRIVFWISHSFSAIFSPSRPAGDRLSHIVSMQARQSANPLHRIPLQQCIPDSEACVFRKYETGLDERDECAASIVFLGMHRTYLRFQFPSNSAENSTTSFRS